MTQQNINIGTNANDGTGDPLRTAFNKINSNFSELFGTTAEANDLLEDTTPQLGGDLDVNGHKITSARSNEQLILDAAGTGTIELQSNTNVTGSLTASGNITATGNIFANGNINLGNASGDQTKVVGVFEADQLQIDGTTLTSTVTNGDVTITGNATGGVVVENLTFNDNTITSPSNSDISIQPGGTGDALVGAIRIHGTTLSSDDSAKITINESLDVTGTLTVAGATVTGVDPSVSLGTSSTLLATQGAIMAYADTKAVLTGSTNNQLTTVTGANAILGEANLTFDGSTLAITGSGSVSGTLTTADINTTGTHTVTGTLNADYIQLKDNKITTNATNSNLEIDAAGTGTIAINKTMSTGDIYTTGIHTITGTIRVDNIGIDSNGIAAMNSNGGININPNGTGQVTIGSVITNIQGHANIAMDTYMGRNLEFGHLGHISKPTSNADLKIETNNGTGLVICNAVGFLGNKITTSNTNEDLLIDPNGTGQIKLSANYWPVASGTADQILKTDGAGNLGWIAQGSPEQKFTYKAANFNTVSGQRYAVDTSSNTVTATLPASPTSGDAIFFGDAKGAYSTNNLTIARNGNTINGAAADHVVSTNNQSIGMLYIDYPPPGGTGWMTY